MQDDNAKLKINKPNLLIISSVTIWLLFAVFVYLSDLITQVLWILILFPFAIFGFAILTNTILILIRVFRLAKQKKPLLQILILLLLNIIVPIALIISPLPELYKINEFRRLQDDRLAVVQNIIDNKYVVSGNTVHLPESDWEMSSSGLVFLISSNDSSYYLFYYTTGIPDGYSGYLYSPDGTIPSRDSLPEHVIEIDKIEDNWYWVEAD